MALIELVNTNRPSRNSELIIRRTERISYKLQGADWLNMENRATDYAATLNHKIIFYKTQRYLFQKLSFRTIFHNWKILAFSIAV